MTKKHCRGNISFESSFVNNHKENPEIKSNTISFPRYIAVDSKHIFGAMTILCLVPRLNEI